MDERRCLEVLRMIREDGGCVSEGDYIAALDHAIATIERVAAAELADVGNDGKNGGESALLSAAMRAGYYSGIPIRLVSER